MSYPNKKVGGKFCGIRKLGGNGKSLKFTHKNDEGNEKNKDKSAFLL
jgi:hypothetical protein